MKLALAALVVAIGCGKTTSAASHESAAPSAQPPPAPAAPAAAPVTPSSPHIASARIVRTTSADRGHLSDAIAREQKAGHTPVLAVVSAECPNCAAVEKWFIGPPFGKVSVIEVDGEAFKRELAPLHVSDSSICLYVLDHGRWAGDLCAMPTGTLGTAVSDSIREQLESHLR